MALSAQGNDDNAGTISEPWRTLSHGLNTITQGDTSTLRADVYRLIEETDLNTPHLTVQGHAGETVEILGSYSTANDTWQPYNANVWRIPADQLTADPKGVFNGHQRIDHQSDLDGGRDHDNVSNLTEPNHWTKADINGASGILKAAWCAETGFLIQFIGVVLPTARASSLWSPSQVNPI